MKTEWLSISLIKIGDYTLLLGQLLSFLAVCLATFLISRLLQKAFKHYLSTQEEQSPQAYVLSRLIHYSVLFIGLMIALKLLGVRLTELTIVASALGVGVGLGLQSMVNNFVSGWMLLLEKTIKVGDYIELANGITGEIIEIYMRVTRIRTNDNIDILIPNGELASGQVTNWTLEENFRRFRIPFGVAYGSDKELVQKAALEAANNAKYTLHMKGREPKVWMTGFGESSLDFVLAVWCQPSVVKHPTTLMSEYLWALDDAFRKYGIEIPFPQRDLHVRSNQVVYPVQINPTTPSAPISNNEE